MFFRAISKVSNYFNSTYGGLNREIVSRLPIALLFCAIFSHMKHVTAILCLVLALLFGSVGTSFAQGLHCTEDSLSKNNRGKYLMTLSGRLFETLAGDRIDAMLWLPSSSLTICGPKNFSYKGKSYTFYTINNTDDGEKVDAFLVNRRGASGAFRGPCSKTSIQKPAPFMGNHDEIFVLSDGSVWQVKYEYEYMYEYYPTVIACPNRGYIIVDGKKLNAQLIRRR